MTQTQTEPVTEDEALASFTSAQWQMTRAAEMYFEAVVERVEGYLEGQAQDPDLMDDDVDELLWGIVDSLDAVTYTHRAYAVLIGADEDRVRNDYIAEMGCDGEATSVEALAHFAIVGACQDKVREMEAWREEYA